MAEDEKYPWTEVCDVYDKSFPVDIKCPKCGNHIISHPDCTESCSNDECDYYSSR